MVSTYLRGLSSLHPSSQTLDDPTDSRYIDSISATQSLAKSLDVNVQHLPPTSQIAELQLSSMNIGDGVHDIVCLIYDNNTALEFDTKRISGTLL